MKLLQFLFATVMCMAMTSCSKFSDGTSVWQGGLWVIPWLTFLGSLPCFYMAYKASKSNSTTDMGGWVKDNTGNVPFYKVGWFYFGCALLVATIVIIIMVNSDK